METATWTLGLLAIAIAIAAVAVLVRRRRAAAWRQGQAERQAAAVAAASAAASASAAAAASAAAEAERAAAETRRAQAEAERAAALRVAEQARAEQAVAEQARHAAAQQAQAEAQRAAAERAAAAEASATAAAAAALAAAERSRETAAPTVPGPRRPEDTLVLVADDSKVVRVKTSRLLAQHGYRVVLAEDGAQAAQLIDVELPSVLITDVEMPGLDGFELTRHVRAHPSARHIPIIMITSSDERLKAAAAEAGVTLVLGKPFPEEALIACIERSQATATA